jgi:DNA-directed RNA polymerase specialized sigma24 family protein
VTLDQARALLRRWFRALEKASEVFPGRSGDILLTAGVKHWTASLTELQAVARVAVLEGFEDVARAFSRLSPRQQEWLWLRYGLELRFRDAREAMGLRHTSAARLDCMALAAFITALGRRWEEGA